jgi:hypothetical protein
MEMSQGNPLYRDIKQTEMSFFKKLKNRRVEQVILQGIGTCGRRGGG